MSESYSGRDLVFYGTADQKGGRVGVEQMED